MDRSFTLFHLRLAKQLRLSYYEYRYRDIVAASRTY